MRSTKPYILAARMRSYGIDAKVSRRPRRTFAKKATVVWEVVIQPRGTKFEGEHGEVVTFLEAYQTGYLAGRKYTEAELVPLLEVIREVDPRREVVNAQQA